MAVVLSITEPQIFASLGGVLNSFGLQDVNGVSPIPIVRGQVNRVPQVVNPDNIVMWPLMRTRLETNVTSYVDASFTGSITSNVLTVTALLVGNPAPGQSLFRTIVTPGCQIIAQLTGPAGGVGTYSVTATANVASGTIYCGTMAIMQPIELMVQLDVHGPTSADNVARITTLWRDPFSVQSAANLGGFIHPLYHDDPRQMPFENAENQIEERWSLDLHMQVNPIVTVPAQFAAALAVSPVLARTTAP